MRFQAWRGLSEGYRKAVEGHSPWKPGTLNPLPVWMDDLGSAPMDESLRKVILEEGIGALAFIPLVSGGRLLGKFMVYYNTPHFFTTAELQFAQAIGGQLAFAIERKRTDESLRESEARYRRINEELSAAHEKLDQHARSLEQTVSDRTAKLRETIAELEAFSYSLSHDMRAPLRSMQGFSQIVLTRYGETIGSPGTDLLKRVIHAAERLDRLIQDVLAFSRLSRQQIQIEGLDLDKLLLQIIHERPELQPPQAQIKIEHPLLRVLGHEASLTQCLTNLLDNAVKFVEPGTIPRILVRTETFDGRVRLWIQDNGIGIEKEVQQRLFGMFQRLHDHRDYPGTGIGLAIVRKAIERMRGQVGVESEPGKGSRFWLELPGAI